MRSCNRLYGELTTVTLRPDSVYLPQPNRHNGIEPEGARWTLRPRGVTLFAQIGSKSDLRAVFHDE